MINTCKTPFYFLRHAQTDHNVHNIYSDADEIHLNKTGIAQALKIQSLIDYLQITTVCSSPLSRAQQTKELALKNKTFKDVILDDLRECPSALWRLFLASESRSLTTEESVIVQNFIKQVQQGVIKAFEHDGPLLFIAHGGTYWALHHILQLKGPNKIDNCALVKVFSDKQNIWTAQFLT